MADINRYLNLITSEHSDKPKYREMITNALEKVDIDIDFDTVFDIDTAEGVQLDIIGQILGLSRELTFQPTDGSSAILTDEYYRDMLKAKQILNQWGGTLETLTDAMIVWNPNLYFSFHDNQDMSLDVIAVGTNDLQKELISNGYIIPKTAGVLYNYTMSESAVFAYDSQTITLTGYGTGEWI